MQGKGLKNPLPGLLWGCDSDDRRERLYLGMYEKSKFTDEVPFIFINADGQEFLIFQEWLCEMLDGKELEIVEGRLSVLGVLES